MWPEGEIEGEADVQEEQQDIGQRGRRLNPIQARGTEKRRAS